MLTKTLSHLVAVAVLIAAGVLAIQHYHQYQNKQAQHAVVVQKQQESLQQQIADIKQSTAAEYVSLQQSYNQAVAECQKGVTAYANLPAVTKQKLPVPTCPAPAK